MFSFQDDTVPRFHYTNIYISLMQGHGTKWDRTRSNDFARPEKLKLNARGSYFPSGTPYFSLFSIMVWQNDITDQAAAAMASIGIPPNPLGEAEQTDEIVGGNEGTTSDESSKKCNEMESQDSGSENEGIQIISSVPVNQEREPDPGMSAKDEATEDMNTRMIGTPEVEQDQEPEPEVATEGEAVAAIGNDKHIKKEGTGFESIGETKKEAKESEVLGNEEARSEEEEVEDMIAPHEAAFIGSIDVTQKDDNQEKPQSVQKEEVGVDDAVPVDNTQAPEEQPAAEKSVYSSSGTETDDSLCVDDRGYSSVTKAPDSTILLGGCPRRLRLYLFSLTIIGMIVGAIVALLFGMGLMGAGRANGSLRATSSATVSPTASPTKSPTFAPVPTASPTVSPTAAPTSDPLLNILKVFSKDRLENTTSPQYHAYEWMRSEDTIIKNPDVDPLRIYQRYALITLYTSLVGEIPSYASDDECTWPRVTCGTTNVVSLAKAEDWQVTELKMAGTSSKGPIPAEIGLLAPSLVHLDLAENPDLNGSIPDEVYSLTRLKNLYLHNCALTGTLREAVANLELLEELFLGNNKVNCDTRDCN